jgi:DNA-binding CsgD family transcriptional regulator
MPATQGIKDPLTPKQLEYLCCVANGMTSQEISEKYFVSIGTVQNTLDAARERAGVRNLPQLVALCVAAGFLTYDEDEE